MAEIIDFAEIQAARRRVRARTPERASLERAIELMKANLAAAANQLVTAPPQEQAELLTRIERLAAMVRYGMRMLGDGPDAGIEGPDRIDSR
ncbi:MAG TPA: hypothetical protein VEC38_05940 [Candidatus Binataceae bacterium]|nr:hypothetical protein [Candidatus Binataceae bacterium]